MKDDVGSKVSSASSPKHDTTATFVLGRRVAIDPLTAAILFGPLGMLVSTTNTIRFTTVFGTTAGALLLIGSAASMARGVVAAVVPLVSDTVVADSLFSCNEIFR